MKRVFSAWTSPDGTEAAFAEGVHPPLLANGRPALDGAVLLWRVEAGSYEEAMAIRNIRLGFGAYVPQGPAAACPKCAAMYYPAGSGQCWHCDHVDAS